MDGKESTQKG